MTQGPDNVDLIEETVSLRRIPLFSTRRGVPVTLSPAGWLAGQILGCNLHGHEVQLEPWPYLRERVATL